MSALALTCRTQEAAEELASLGRWRLRPGQPLGSWADEDRGVKRPGRQNSCSGPGLSGPMASKSPSKGPREGEWPWPMSPEPPKTILAGAVTWAHPGVVWRQQPQPLCPEREGPGRYSRNSNWVGGAECCSRNRARWRADPKLVLTHSGTRPVS